MKLCHNMINGVVLLLGMVHMIFTAVFFPALNLEAVWFAGSGLVFVVLAFFNFARPAAESMFSWGLCLSANFMVLIFSVVILVQMSEIQAVVAAMVMFFLVLTTVATRPRP